MQFVWCAVIHFIMLHTSIPVRHTSQPPHIPQHPSLEQQPEEEADKKAAFLAELSKINTYLAANGPLFGGNTLNETDAATAPKLYHATVALGHYKGWSLDAAQFPAVAAYMEKLKGMPAWQHALPSDGDAAVVAGWGKHMSG